MLPLRLPAPGKGAIAVEVGDHPNSQGFCHPVGVDLQRVYACLEVSLEEDSNANLDYEYLSDVATSSSSFSPKITVQMSSQVEWRTDDILLLLPGLTHIHSSHVFFHLNQDRFFRVLD